MTTNPDIGLDTPSRSGPIDVIRNSATTDNDATGDPALAASIDRFSLEQALIDAEIATARAHDLALRLVELRAELRAEQGRHAALIERAETAERLYEEIVHNRAYGLATKVWTARRLIGG